MLERIASRYAPSRILSFQEVHVFKTLQLLAERKHVGRDLLCKELSLGEGSIKTLVKHLKMHKLIITSNGGTKLSEKGRTIASDLVSHIPRGTNIQRCSVALGKYNHAVLLKSLSFAVKSGIEQRDAAVKMGAIGATTFLFRAGKFVMPTDSSEQDSLENEPRIRRLLTEKLNPEDDDVIIIGSSNENARMAELAAKNAALVTLVNHEKHDAINA